MCDKCTVMLSVSPSAKWIMGCEVEYRAKLYVPLHHCCKICLRMTAWEWTCIYACEKSGAAPCACVQHTFARVYKITCMWWGTVAEASSKKNKYWNKPKHHLSWFNYEVLCKSNWVEHKAPASYFSLNCARSKVKRITFEVFPAREGGRRSFRVNPPVSVFPLIAASQKAAHWQFYTQLDKSGVGSGGSWKV